MPSASWVVRRRHRDPSDAGPLPPEQAFRFEAIADGPDAVLARFTMPPGYYLYRAKSQIELQAGNGIRLGQPQWPKGVQHQDEHFGTTEVYFDEADIRIPLARQNRDAQPIRLKAVFQGCQDGGICYPLMTRTVSLDLPAGGIRCPGTGTAGLGRHCDSQCTQHSTDREQ